MGKIFLGRASERASGRMDGQGLSARSLARSLVRWGGSERASERTDGRPREGAVNKGFLNKGPLVRGRPRSVGSLARWGASERASQRADGRASGRAKFFWGWGGERESERASGRTDSQGANGRSLAPLSTSNGCIHQSAYSCVHRPSGIPCLLLALGGLGSLLFS